MCACVGEELESLYIYFTNNNDGDNESGSGGDSHSDIKRPKGIKIQTKNAHTTHGYTHTHTK